MADEKDEANAPAPPPALRAAKAPNRRASKKRSARSKAKSGAKPARAKRARTKARAKTKATEAKPAAASVVSAGAGRPFPKEPLERALKVAETLRAKNAGNPWPPADIAAAMNMAVSGKAFFYVAAASRDYGLTEGSRDTDVISLTDLGRSVVYPESANEVIAAKQTAFRKVKLFNDVLDYYKGNNLPELTYVQNTLLRNFHIAESHHEEFVKVFKENCEFVGLKEGLLVTGDGVGERRKVPADTGHTVTIGGDPGTGLTCFIAMPFSERDPKRPKGFFAEVLARLITLAAQDAGFRVITADRRGSDMIHATIVNDLLDADLVVADLTDHNPNVLFEVGMRMHEDKPVALIQAAGTNRIFDVDNVLRAYSYDPNLWASTLEKDRPNLAAHIKGAWDARENGVTYMKLLRQQPPKT